MLRELGGCAALTTLSSDGTVNGAFRPAPCRPEVRARAIGPRRLPPPRQGAIRSSTARSGATSHTFDDLIAEEGEDRSGRFFDAVRTAFRAGMLRDDVEDAMRRHPAGWAGKYLRPDRLATEIARAWGKVEAKAREEAEAATGEAVTPTYPDASVPVEEAHFAARSGQRASRRRRSGDGASRPPTPRAWRCALDLKAVELAVKLALADGDADGDALPAAAESFTRSSPALEDYLRTASAAVDALRAEHAGKVSTLTAAHRAVLGAADGVMTVEAEAIARELNAADARALALRVRLHCFANRRAADWVVPIAAPPKMMPGGWLAADPVADALSPVVRQTAVIGQAIASAPVPQSGGPFSTNWTAENAAWSAYAAALAADPQAGAAFADGPAVPPSTPLPSSRAA